MVLGSLFFATMAVCVKIASAWFNSAELVFYRGLLGMLFMWLLARGRGVSLATRYPGHARLAQPGGRAVAGRLVLRHRPAAAGHRHDAELHEQRLDRGLPGRRRPARLEPRQRRQSAPPRQGPLVLTVLGRLRRASSDAAAHHRPEPGVRGPGGPDVGPHGRLCLHAGDGAGQAGRARNAHGVLFRRGLGRCRRRRGGGGAACRRGTGSTRCGCCRSACWHRWASSA